MNGCYQLNYVQWTLMCARRKDLPPASPAPPTTDLHKYLRNGTSQIQQNTEKHSEALANNAQHRHPQKASHIQRECFDHLIKQTKGHMDVCFGWRRGRRMMH